jgi:hypothetical protein
MNPSAYDGRKPEPPYITDVEQAVLAERENCAAICETLEWRLEVREWLELSKKQISVRLAKDLALAIRNQ